MNKPRQYSASEMERMMKLHDIREIHRGDAVVLGYGISAFLPHLMLAEGRFSDATLAIEQGSIGGLPLTGFGFGSSANPLAILDAPGQFDLFNGGGYDEAMLSLLQVDPQGRVNVHRLDARPNLSTGDTLYRGCRAHREHYGSDNSTTPWKERGVMPERFRFIEDWQSKDWL